MNKYLKEIVNWQLYKAIEKKLVLYEMNSSNIIEIIFRYIYIYINTSTINIYSLLSIINFY